jgi:hypothetical protein
MDEDRRNALLLYALIGIVVAFAFALIAYGYYKDRIAPNHETVLKVGGREFDLAFIDRRVNANVKLGMTSGATTVQDLIVRTVQSVELEEITRRAAGAAGIEVTGADIDAYIRQRIGLREDAANDAFAALYRQDVLKSGLPVSEYREIWEAQIIQDRLIEKFEAAVPAQEEQVDAQLLRTADEAAARQAKSNLEGGAEFNVTAASVSIDESKSSGGEVGWVTRSELPPKVADALFTLPIGQISDVIQDNNGWYLVVARGREVRDIDGSQKSRIGVAKFNSLLLETRSSVASDVRLTEEQIARLGRKLLGS